MIKDYLQNAAARGKMSHAYIIEGDSADLRKQAAEDFIRILMAKDEHATAQIEAGTHPDIVWVTHEKPLTISVKEIRDQLCDTMAVRPFEGGWKLYIIEDAELMPPGAQNALLKTVEEPPEYGCILLMTKNQEMLLETIRSRCITLKCDRDLKAASFERQDLLEDLDFDIASHRQHIDSVRASEITAEVLAEGPEGPQEFLNAFRARLRDLAAEHAGSDSFDMARVNAAMDLIDRAETRLKFNVNSQLTIEMMLMEI